MANIHLQVSIYHVCLNRGPGSHCFFTVSIDPSEDSQQALWLWCPDYTPFPHRQPQVPACKDESLLMIKLTKEPQNTATTTSGFAVKGTHPNVYLAVFNLWKLTLIPIFHRKHLLHE